MYLSEATPQQALTRRVLPYYRRCWKWPPIFTSPSTTTQVGSGLVVPDFQKGTVSFREGREEAVIATLHPTKNYSSSFYNFRGLIAGDNFRVQIRSRWFRSPEIHVQVKLSDGTLLEGKPKPVIPWQFDDLDVLDLVRCSRQGPVRLEGSLSETQSGWVYCANVAFVPEFQNLARILGPIFLWEWDQSTAN